MGEKVKKIVLGMGYILNSYSTIMNSSNIQITTQANDLENMKSDWIAVGKSIRRGMDEVGTSKNNKSSSKN